MIRDYSEHIGEQNINKKGTLMTIIEFKNTNDITIQFHDDTKSIKKTTYGNFTRKTVKSPYDKTIYGIACIGEGKWKVTGDKGYGTNEYSVWHGILARCYTECKQIKQPTYIGCSVSKDWHNYQNFRNWWEDNYYEIGGNERMELDKDILFKDNKVYSAQTCCFIPQRINLVLINRKNCRGETPLGVRKSGNKFFASYIDINQHNQKSGTYDTKEEAFEHYKSSRENVYKQLANEYKDRIPLHIYEALYNRKIKITD